MLTLQIGTATYPPPPRGGEAMGIEWPDEPDDGDDRGPTPQDPTPQDGGEDD